MSIPKKIHYCWFGKNDKPKIVKKCIESWFENLPGYEIIEWNEENFNININSYVKEAYEAKKFAFVSDFVRVYALYQYGGIYLDTDVEVYKSFDEFLQCESFWGFEQGNFIATSTIGSTKENKLVKIFLDSFQDKRFISLDGSPNELTNVAVISQILKEHGLLMNGTYQQIKGFGTFFPQTYFSPYDYINCRKFISQDTYTIHYFYKSWLPPMVRIKSYLKIISSKIIGGNNIAKIRAFLSQN
jgi:hypothetical protein